MGNASRVLGVVMLAALPGDPVFGQVEIEPCKLLTGQEAASVVPNHGGGEVAHAGGSLIKGVDAFQCSYINTDAELLTVIVNVAVDDARFQDIKPSFSLMNDVKKLPIGDGAWLRGDDDDMKVTVLKGRAVIDLELMAPGAKQKVDALVKLAQAVATRL